MQKGKPGAYDGTEIAAEAELETGEKAVPHVAAPIFCAPSAETVESMENGIRNRKLMIFSTMSTAAASARPRRLERMVITIKEIWIKPSCSVMGMPIFRIFPSPDGGA